eukprot:TRINITY_DN11113_c0_g1_i1.p1 TRINITY_DN11113_c0_g1~~TRINITY_DN11113_c0_g1_i1.p1  ORF type:complete len:264 (+),score=64.09 TRINITY_DN11113_c0_g1_i1:111-902(+)
MISKGLITQSLTQRTIQRSSLQSKRKINSTRTYNNTQLSKNNSCHTYQRFNQQNKILNDYLNESKRSLFYRQFRDYSKKGKEEPEKKRNGFLSFIMGIPLWIVTVVAIVIGIGIWNGDLKMSLENRQVYHDPNVLDNMFSSSLIRKLKRLLKDNDQIRQAFGDDIVILRKNYTASKLGEKFGLFVRKGENLKIFYYCGVFFVNVQITGENGEKGLLSVMLETSGSYEFVPLSVKVETNTGETFQIMEEPVYLTDRDVKKMLTN